MSVNLSTSPRGLWMTSDKNDGPGKMCIKLRILLNTLNKKNHTIIQVSIKKRNFFRGSVIFCVRCTLTVYSVTFVTGPQKFFSESNPI